MGKTASKAMTFEKTTPRKIGKKPKKIKVTSEPKHSTGNTARDAYKVAKNYHKDQITALKTEIKRQRLLIKQAKISYKLSK